MYFTVLRVSNLLLFNITNLQELVYKTLGTEIQSIKGGRSNQLISLRENAQTLLNNDFYDDVTVICKDKDSQDPVFTAENNLSLYIE